MLKGLVGVILLLLSLVAATTTLITNCEWITYTSALHPTEPGPMTDEYFDVERFGFTYVSKSR